MPTRAWTRSISSTSGPTSARVDHPRAPTTSLRTPSRPTSTTRDGGCSRRRDPGASRRRARLVRLVPHHGHGSRAHRGPRSDRGDDRLRDGHRRLRRGVGRRHAADRLGVGRPGRRRLRRSQPRPPDARRPTRSALRDRRLRNQRPDLGVAAQLHLDAHRDARLLRARARRPSARLRSRSTDRTRPRRDRPARRPLERVAGGFEFTEGPVWTPDGALLFSSPNTNAIYRWTPAGHRRLPLEERLHRARHRPLPPAGVERADVRLARPAHDLPARRAARPERRPARRYNGACRQLRRQAAEQPERPRVPLRRDALLHRPAVRPARRLRRPGQGDAVQRRLPRSRRHRLARDRRARRPERARLLTRRAIPVRRRLGSRAQGRDALRGRRRRLARAAPSSTT